MTNLKNDLFDILLPFLQYLYHNPPHPHPGFTKIEKNGKHSTNVGAHYMRTLISMNMHTHPISMSTSERLGRYILRLTKSSRMSCFSQVCRVPAKE